MEAALGDIYTRVLLAVIAAALIVIAAQNASKPALAQLVNCGSEVNPCFVALKFGQVLVLNNSSNPVPVKITP
jgi:hypothetical protein